MNACQPENIHKTDGILQKFCSTFSRSIKEDSKLILRPALKPFAYLHTNLTYLQNKKNYKSPCKLQMLFCQENVLSVSSRNKAGWFPKNLRSKCHLLSPYKSRMVPSQVDKEVLLLKRSQGIGITEGKSSGDLLQNRTKPEKQVRHVNLWFFFFLRQRSSNVTYELDVKNRCCNDKEK